LQVLARVAPSQGRALEIASGTGEHIIVFAEQMPGLIWQPTDIDAARIASIAAWAETKSLANLRPPKLMNAGNPGWGVTEGPVDLINLVNLLHLIADHQVEVLISQLAVALAPNGIACLYGPFLRDGIATSAGDAAFHAELRAQDPATGYKDLDWVLDRLTRAGLSIAEVAEMPANNLMIIARQPAV
jgi:SAM-dependent methyltransferase